DGDGYADKSTVYAKGFNSIQGLAYHDGNLYVMHAPYLSLVRDGTGAPASRIDLLEGSGLPPEKNRTRRHCANGLTVGHDGYPYLYDQRPDEALRPIADLGLGSSAGGVCYLETAFPKEYRGDLFFCEWGRSVVRYSPRAKGSAFDKVKEVEFAVAAENDP